MASLDQQDHDWRIQIRQQPRQCKVCSISKSGLHDRRWIEQIPILQIIDNNEFQRYPLLSSDVDDVNQDVLVGTKQTSIQKLEDKDGRYGWFFIFPDLSVTQTGDFCLKFHLYQLKGTNRGSAAFWLYSVTSQKFTVYSRRDYPGPLSATQLSRVFRKQGIRVRLSKKTLSSSDHTDSQSESGRKEHHKKKRRKELRLQRSVPSISSESTSMWRGSSLKRPDQEEYPSNWRSTISQASIESERQQSPSMEKEEDSSGLKSEERLSAGGSAQSERHMHPRFHYATRDQFLSGHEYSSGESIRTKNEESLVYDTRSPHSSGFYQGSDFRSGQPSRAIVSPDPRPSAFNAQPYLFSGGGRQSSELSMPGRPMSAPARNNRLEGNLTDEHLWTKTRSLHPALQRVGSDPSEFDIHSQKASSEGRTLRPLEAHLSSAAALTTIDEAQMKSLSLGAREFLKN